MTRISLIMLLLSSRQLPLLALAKHTSSGYLRENKSQGFQIRESAYRSGTSIGAVSNTYGFYSTTLPAAGSFELTFSKVG